MIKLGRVRFKVKDVVWGAAVAGGGTADMLGDQEEILRDELEEAELVKTSAEVIW